MASKPRKTATKSKKPSTRKKTESKIESRLTLNPQVKAIIMFAIAIVLLILALFRGEHLWRWLNSVLYGFFGFCSFLVPVVLGYFAVMTAKEKQVNRLGTKIALTVLVVLCVSSLFYLFGGSEVKDGNFFVAIGKSYSYSSNQPFSGGIISCILGYLLTALIGDNFVPKLLVIIVLVVVVMVLTGITIVDIERVAKKQMRALRERKKQHDEKKRLERESAYDDDYGDISREGTAIDIPIDNKKKKKHHATPDVAMDDESEAPLETSAADKLINSVRIANGEYNDDTDIYQASEIARQISESKNNPLTEEGAKQANPETAHVDPKATEEQEDDDTVFEAPEKQETEPFKAYTYPSVRLLRQRFDSDDGDAMRELQNNATKLVDTLKSFGVSASITTIAPSASKYSIIASAISVVNLSCNCGFLA